MIPRSNECNLDISGNCLCRVNSDVTLQIIYMRRDPSLPKIKFGRKFESHVFSELKKSSDARQYFNYTDSFVSQAVFRTLPL